MKYIFLYNDKHKKKNYFINKKTQTYEYSTKSSKVSREIGIQMEREGLYIDLRKDKFLDPKIYFTSEMWDERRKEATLYIQRHFRRILAKNRTNYLRKLKEDKIKEQLQKEEEYRKNDEIKHKKEIERRMHPRSKEDFSILFEELELWRVNEIEKIKNNSSLDENEKQKALKQILDKETELLQTIDRLKIIANKENKEAKIAAFLKSMSDPRKWKRKSDGRFTEVHDPFTTRAKELMDIYNGLKMRNLTIDERLDILLNTKWTVKEYDRNLTREIEELIDREADMINRGRPESSLEGILNIEFLFIVKYYILIFLTIIFY